MLKGWPEWQVSTQLSPLSNTIPRRYAFIKSLLTYAAGFSFLHSIKNITSALNNFLDRMEINYLITFYMVVIYDWTQRQKVGT